MAGIMISSARRRAMQAGAYAGLLVFLCGTTVQAQYGPYVNGSLFVIGLYDYPGGGIPDSHFGDIKNYFNTVDYFCHNANWDNGDTPETLTTATLNSAATNGLYITSEMWVTSDPPHDYCDKPAQFVTGSSFYNDLQTFGADPALLMFANRDEADDYMAATQCVAASNFMGTYGRGKNVWLNLSSMMDLPVSGFQKYVPGATVVSTDAYPDEWGGNLDSEMNAVDTLHAITPVSKMIVLPGYPGASGNLLADANRMNYVTYTCVIHGASGIWYWGCDQLASTSDPVWQNIRIAGSQLKFMQDALVNPKSYRYYNSNNGTWVGTGITASGGSGNLEVLLVTNASYDYLITANTSASSQTYIIGSLAGWRGGTNLWYFCGSGGTNNQVLGKSITYGPKQAVVYASQSIKVPPAITVSLSPQTCASGASIEFNVGSVSWWPQSYQWYFNGNPIGGQTAATLALNNVQTNNAGVYSVVISNGEGSVTNATSLAVQAYFGPTATIASDLDVMTNGAFVYAYDLSGTTAAVNGVTFIGTTSTTALGSDVMLSGLYANYNAYGSSSAPYSGLSSGYKNVLMGGDYASGANAVAITLKNLTIGRAYAVQLWVDDSRSFGNGRTMTVTSGGSTTTLNYNNTGSDGGVGQYAISTFTAGATTQAITILGNNSTQINAIQLRDISGIAPIAFGAGTTIAGDTDVATAGTPVYAYDLAGTTVTVNGVVFTGAMSTTALGFNVTLSGLDGGNYNGYGVGITNLSANYTNILTGGDYANGATVVTVTLKNLTIGHAYAVQLWVDDSRSFGYGLGRTITVTTLATNANSVTLGYDLAGLGQYTIGTFTASAPTETFTVAGNSSTQINALQLRDISGLAPIIFSIATTIAGDADVSTAGAFVYAYDLSGIAATVNGVTFTGATSTTSLGSDVTLSGFDGGNYNGYGTDITNLSASYINVLTGGDYANGATVVAVTLKNLTVGHSYAVELWVDDSRSFGFGVGRTITAATIANNANSVTLGYNLAGLGQYAIGTFTASATTETFTITGNNSTQINALLLRDMSVSAGNIRIAGVVRNIDGSVTLRATGTGGSSYVTQFKTNLSALAPWQNISTNAINGAGQWQFTDTNANNYQAGFYRLLYQP